MSSYKLLVHEPTFVIAVSVDDLRATGTGRSKKYAKHVAAKNLLDHFVTAGHHLMWGIPYETDQEALQFMYANFKYSLVLYSLLSILDNL